MFGKYSRGIAAVTVLFISTGCATTQVKDVTVNKMGHLQQNFAFETLHPSVQEKLAKSPSGPKNFTKIKFTIQATSETDGKTKKQEVTDTYVNDKNGVILRLREISNHGLLHTLMYSTSYRGALNLKIQRVSLSREFAPGIEDIREFSQFDQIPLTPQKNQEYAFDYSYALNPIQIMNFLNGKFKCETESQFAANTLNPKLSGEAMGLHCEVTGPNGAVQSKSKLAFLKEYGFAIELEATGPSYKNVLSITDVSIQ